MSELWSQRMAAAVKKWGGSGPDLDGRYAARPLTDLSSYGYIKKIEKVARMLSIESPFFRPTDGRVGSMALIDGKKYVNFAWCNYLGLNEHPSVAEAAKEGARSIRNLHLSKPYGSGRDPAASAAGGEDRQVLRASRMHCCSSAGTPPTCPRSAR